MINRKESSVIIGNDMTADVFESDVDLVIEVSAAVVIEYDDSNVPTGGVSTAGASRRMSK